MVQPLGGPGVPRKLDERFSFHVGQLLAMARLESRLSHLDIAIADGTWSQLDVAEIEEEHSPSWPHLERYESALLVARERKQCVS